MKLLQGNRSLNSPLNRENLLDLKSKVENWSFTFSPEMYPIALSDEEKGHVKSFRPRSPHLHAEQALTAAVLSCRDRIILLRSYFRSRSHILGFVRQIFTAFIPEWAHSAALGSWCCWVMAAMNHPLAPQCCCFPSKKSILRCQVSKPW